MTENSLVSLLQSEARTSSINPKLSRTSASRTSLNRAKLHPTYTPHSINWNTMADPTAPGTSTPIADPGKPRRVDTSSILREEEGHGTQHPDEDEEVVSSTARSSGSGRPLSSSTNRSSRSARSRSSRRSTSPDTRSRCTLYQQSCLFHHHLNRCNNPSSRSSLQHAVPEVSNAYTCFPVDKAHPSRVKSWIP